MQTIHFYYIIAKKYWVHLLALFILQPIAIYIDTVPISYIYKEVTNKLKTAPEELYVYVWELVYWYAIIFVLWRLIGYAVVYFESFVKRDLEQFVFKHLTEQSYKFHLNRFSGSLVAQTNRFVGAFERLFDTLYFEILRVSLYLVFGIVVLWQINVTIALLTLLWAIFFIVSSVFLQQKKSHLSAYAAQEDSKVTARLADSLSNMFTIKIFAKEKDEARGFNEVSNKRAIAVSKDWLSAEFIYAWQAFIMLSFEIYLLKFSIDLATSHFLDVGQIVQIQIIVFPLMRNLWGIGKTIRNIERSFSDSLEMTKILAHKPSIVDVPSAKDIEIKKGEIIFDNVTFTYNPVEDEETNEEESLFYNFNLTIKAGERVALVGKSGSGKTTLTKLLMRLMDIQSGTIKIDGVSILDLTQKALRSSISYVPQEPNLFHRTLSHNIAYGNIHANQDTIEDAARLAEAHTFITKLPKGYNTLVGERGTKLSGGERQRVTIARAILKNAPIVVLDEATSALDSESEIVIQKALAAVMEGKTAIVIAHRLSTIQRLDRIIVLDNGAVIEDGTHTELIQKKGTYARLWEHQSGGFIQE
jgi:ATP-binding cassette, subfamily B, bacterial